MTLSDAPSEYESSDLDRVQWRTLSHRPSSEVERRRRRGLSLIELLVVIAIIGALGAILIPVVGSVRLSADKVEASQMLRQLGVTIQLYCNDNDGQFPDPVKNLQYAYMPQSTSRQLSWRLRHYWVDDFKKGSDIIIPALGYSRFFEEYDPLVFSPIAMNSRVVINYNPETRVNPFESGTTPYLNTVVSNPSSQVALFHVDAQAVNEKGTSLGGGNVPLEPLLKDGRMALFFDWHVELMPLDYRLGEWTP